MKHFEPLFFPTNRNPFASELLPSFTPNDFFVSPPVLRGGRTETGLALKRLSRGFPGGRNGSVPQILIIVTDGKSQGPVALPAKQLRERGIVVFAVGVHFPR